MSLKTDNFKLYKYEDNDIGDLRFINDSMDKIDNGLVLDVGTSTGTGNNYVLDIGSLVLKRGMSLKFWADKNSNGTVTINGTYNLVKDNGNPAKNIKRNALYIITYDGNANFFLASGGVDDVNFTSDKLLTGYSANDSNGEKVNGTMVNLSESSPIQCDSSNPTKVVKADAVFQQKNTDNVERLLLRYNGNGGYITNNTLFGLPIADVANGIHLTADKLLEGSTILGVKGGIPNKGAVTVTLNAGGSYTIPAGYHNGSGKVTVNSSSSQIWAYTPGTITLPSTRTDTTVVSIPFEPSIVIAFSSTETGNTYSTTNPSGGSIKWGSGNGRFFKIMSGKYAFKYADVSNNRTCIQDVTYSGGKLTINSSGSYGGSDFRYTFMIIAIR